MTDLHPVSYVGLAAASFVAGAINSVAGGGTLLTFPSLLAAGVPPVVANATSTVALVPGSLAGAYSFRKNMQDIRRLLLTFALPSLIGGFVGAKLMLMGGDRVLAKLVPWLIFGAAVLFLLQEPISRMTAKRMAGNIPAETAGSQAQQANQLEGQPASTGMIKNAWLVAGFIFFVAIYGGYFGAGIGILTLAALGFLGLTNIHQMNGLKNILAASINLVATITFVMAGRVDGLIALIMAVGAVFGALSGAGLALKIGQKRVRQIVIAIGFGIAAIMFWRQGHGG